MSTQPRTSLEAPSPGRWPGVPPEEVIVILESRLAAARRSDQDLLAVMRAAAAALNQDGAESRTRAQALLTQGLLDHVRSEAHSPKRSRRRAKRQATQTQALISQVDISTLT